MTGRFRDGRRIPVTRLKIGSQIDPWAVTPSFRTGS
jgi:hypothetical protein